MFVAKEILSRWSHKIEHFKKNQQETQLPFNHVLFFDDENRNIEAVSKMGVTSILVNNGVTIEWFENSISFSNFI
ncbi:hypothetical protein L1887_24537 [Cichorium endivia]|nr:hypothetical protein L1887_24537 [Cichorium endivia]